VELACELASSVRHVLLPELGSRVARCFRLVLVEPQETVLAGFDERLQAAARAALARLGVEVIRSAVVGADSGAVELSSGERLEAEHLIWAAGGQGVRGRLAPGRRRHTKPSGCP
jgi:NADH dehydrogenase FAD-containing subunit